jgi:uroporphyrinogen decarboxylase
MWMPFFHIVAFYLGMENYFIKMHTHPELIEALIEKILDFYLEANRRCLDAMAPKLDAVFFGNDMGSQEDLLISPDAFNRFVLPGYKKIVEQAKSYNLKVILHSCGAISKIIPQIIDAGIDGLHPLQAKAKGMEAEKLAGEYKGKLLFIGGVDTQQLLPNGTPEQVAAEVKRLKELFGERYIVSPSHETLLPNVGIENVLAMRDAALE